MEEVMEAAVLRPCDRSFDSSKTLDGTQTKRTCTHLVEFDRQDRRLVFAHQSIYEFLTHGYARKNVYSLAFALRRSIMKICHICLREYGNANVEIEKCVRDRLSMWSRKERGGGGAMVL